MRHLKSIHPHTGTTKLTDLLWVTSWELWDGLSVASLFCPSLWLQMSGLLSLPVCERASISLPERYVVLLPALPLRCALSSPSLTLAQADSGRSEDGHGRVLLSPSLSFSPSLSPSLPRCQNCGTVLTPLSSACQSFHWAACYLTISFLSLHWFSCLCLSRYRSFDSVSLLRQPLAAVFFLRCAQSQLDYARF